MNKNIFLGLLSALFFSLTFILSREMNLSGGSFIWTASLRFFSMFPFLFLIIFFNKRLKYIISTIKENIFQWLLWSTIGFGIFYLSLTFSSSYGSSWTIASIWQLTILSGILLTPFFKKKLPKEELKNSLIILLGVGIIAIDIGGENINLAKVILPIIIASFAYPLGNRKMMEICNNKLSTLERIFGMTLCSLPFWIILSFYEITQHSLPSNSQIIQSIIVGIFSGIIATSLFFKATDNVKHNPKHLAIVESTQSGEIIFTLLGEAIFFTHSFPNKLSLVGISIIVIGIIFNSIKSEAK
ncbi:MAG: multidrug resistance efflux transporter family protein [Cetobacterium sp.]|nr:multidrug resistance efflux transporter family protein [Cetobacterium sp.]